MATAIASSKAAVNETRLQNADPPRDDSQGRRASFATLQRPFAPEYFNTFSPINWPTFAPPQWPTFTPPLTGGILRRIQQISGNRLEIQQGSFYPAIYRLEHQGWIEGEWGESENNRKAKFYRLTATGRRQLRTETDRWAKMTGVVGDILTATPEEV